jgi:small subunit ribosomal protein S18
MAVVRKVTPKNITPKAQEAEDVEKVEEAPVEAAEVAEEKGAEGGKRTATVTKKACFFHKSESEPVYWDATALRKFMNDRGRIQPRQRTGNCAKHQRRLSQAIKRARFLALLPYSAGI